MKDETLKLIIKYNKINERKKEIIKYLYDNTELFEEKYMQDYNDELFRFFAGKISQCANETNTIYSRMSKRDLSRLKFLELTEEI